jgi:hypothetical protein
MVVYYQTTCFGPPRAIIRSGLISNVRENGVFLQFAKKYIVLSYVVYKPRPDDGPERAETCSLIINRHSIAVVYRLLIPTKFIPLYFTPQYQHFNTCSYRQTDRHTESVSNRPFVKTLYFPFMSVHLFPFTFSSLANR